MRCMAHKISQPSVSPCQSKETGILSKGAAVSGRQFRDMRCPEPHQYGDSGNGLPAFKKVPLTKAKKKLRSLTAETSELSGRLDLNQRPLAPQASALPGCATSREMLGFQKRPPHIAAASFSVKLFLNILLLIGYRFAVFVRCRSRSGGSILRSCWCNRCSSPCNSTRQSPGIDDFLQNLTRLKRKRPTFTDGN